LPLMALRGLRPPWRSSIHSHRPISESVRPMQDERKMKYSVIFSAQVLSLLLQVLRLIFVVGCQFDERFPYENVEALARQSLAFLRLSMKVFFRLHRMVPHIG